MNWLHIFAHIFITPLLAVSAFFGLHANTTIVPTPTSTAPIACTEEAKLCPDGSYVGRIAPDCHFAQCPSVATSTASQTTPSPAPTPKPIPVPTPEPVVCTMEAKLCPDGSYVGRTGPHCEFAACPSSATSTQMLAPSIYSVTPLSASVGAQVIIGGDNFTENTRVHFGAGVITKVTIAPAVFHCPLQQVGDTRKCGDYTQTLTFTIPQSVGPYCKSGMMCPMFLQEITPGTYNISVENDAGLSATKQFTVTNK